jgi:hypothetical protein
VRRRRPRRVALILETKKSFGKIAYGRAGWLST